MTTDTTSNPQGGLDWEDVCLDPHHGSLEQGKAEGREAGALAGFREGRGLGQTKGLEFALEVGFYQGVVSALLTRTMAESSSSSSPASPSTNDDDHPFSERVRKSIQKLQEAIDAFPSPDEIFSHKRKGGDDASVMEAMKSLSATTTPAGEDTTDATNVADDSEGDPSNNKFDILHKLQRIRARFKLVVVQLGKPQFSLQNALLETTPSSPSKTTATNSSDDATGGDQEW